MESRNVTWWCKCIVHNMIIHPILPLADALERTRLGGFSRLMYKMHDLSAPAGGG